ncbi:MAG: alanine--tRNA ligase [Candidatus Woesearchaeota archaeon]
MLPDKQVKKEFKVEASKNPDKYYATSVLKAEGFMRKQCSCGTFFWTVNPEQKVCGDPACSGGFRFIGNTPATKKLDYVGVWKEFARLFSKWGYTPINRYPVVARWRDDTDFVQASIYDFQPYVVSGEVEPPANPLVVPQMCLRFNDIDNIGITGAHYCAFVMIGQHAFMPEEKWSQPRFFTDIHNWLKQGLGLKNEEITFHEDAWAGGGNFGPCMEYFSRGLELGNQVYMMFEQTPSGNKPLKLKVLDMGMGHERNAWFTQGHSTSYETTFPTVVKKLYQITGLRPDPKLVAKFLPYSSYLNVDEVDNIDTAWQNVAKGVGVDVLTLKKTIIPLAAMYSVAEHARALLVAISDGALPSNVGGGYNLRIILRRALGFIDSYGWNIDLPAIARLHADYLKPLFPELSENLNEVSEILDFEKKKYIETREKSKVLISQSAQSDLDEKQLLQLYDSHGIAPEMIREEAERLGKKVVIPDNFYTKVAQLHEKVEQEHATERKEKLDLSGVPDTILLYFDDFEKIGFTAKVLKVIGNNVLLDKTAFYPTSGGQLHDLGKLNNVPVLDVFKQGAVVVHLVADHAKFHLGENAEGQIDFERRKQLAQHHTATHIVNAAARKVLGKHINQAGAKKTEEKAHLDITHYQLLTDEEVKKIEFEANEIISKHFPVRSFFLSRSDAEKKYGMAIYQGGAVPGKSIRIIEIPGIDVEACAGTHLHNTSEAGQIKILKTSKVQDGIIRITFAAGSAVNRTAVEATDVLSEAASILGCPPDVVPTRAQELFDKWKAAKKKVKKGEKLSPNDIQLVSNEKYSGDSLKRTADILRTQPQFIVNTIKKFKNELDALQS